MKLFAVLLLLCSVGLAKAKHYVWYPVDMWTRMNVYHCKETSPTQLHCEVDVTVTGFSLKPPTSGTAEFPKSKIELSQ